MTNAIQCTGVSKWFGESPALVGVDFAVETGSRVALFGGNGAGKTTLLRLIATLATPSEGVISLGGFDTSRDAGRARSWLGFVGHEPGIYGDLTVEENLEFFGRLYGVPGLRPRVKEMIEAVGLWRARRQRARTLSRGMRQRLGIARALLPEPSILLLDEPDTGLDLEATAFVERVMLTPHRTTLFATHDRAWGERLAERVLVLERGRLVEDRATPTAGNADGVDAPPVLVR